MTRVKGHYRKVEGKRVWVKPHQRKTSKQKQTHNRFTRLIKRLKREVDKEYPGEFATFEEFIFESFPDEILDHCKEVEILDWEEAYPRRPWR